MERFMYRLGFAVLLVGLILVMGALTSCESVNVVRVLDLSGSAGAETLGVSALDVRTGRSYEGLVSLSGAGRGPVAEGPVPAAVYIDAAGMHVGAAWRRPKRE